MRKIFIFLLLLISNNILHSMKLSDIHKKNCIGQMPLHGTALCVPWVVSDLKTFDEKRAIFAATFIHWGSSVYVADDQGRTPFFYAELNKSVLPTVYKVMLAGKIKEDMENSLPKPDRNGAYNLFEVLAAAKTRDPREFIEWQKALEIINEHRLKDNK